MYRYLYVYIYMYICVCVCVCVCVCGKCLFVCLLKIHGCKYCTTLNIDKYFGSFLAIIHFTPLN